MTDIFKSGIPDDQAQWDVTSIVECVGTPEEHEDKMYRHENWGIEEHTDGKYQVYAIVDNDPILVKDDFVSFKEATEFIRGSLESKRLATAAPAGGAPDADPGEKVEMAQDAAAEAPVVKETPEIEPPKKEDFEQSDESDHSSDVQDEIDDRKEENEKEETDPEEKSFPSFKSLMEKNAKPVDDLPMPPQVEDQSVWTAPYRVVRIGQGKQMVSGVPRRMNGTRF